MLIQDKEQLVSKKIYLKQIEFDQIDQDELKKLFRNVSFYTPRVLARYLK